MTKRRETVFVLQLLGSGAAVVDARVHAAALAGRAVHPQPDDVRPAAIGARGPLRTKNTTRWTRGAGRPARRRTLQRRRAGGRPAACSAAPAVSDTLPSGSGAAGRARAAAARGAAGGGEAGTSVMRLEPVPAAADRLAVAGHPAAGAVAAVEQQRRRRAGAARTSALPSPLKSPPDGERGEPRPAAADRLAVAGDPAAGAVAAVQQQLPVAGRRASTSGLPSPLKSPPATARVNGSPAASRSARPLPVTQPPSPSPRYISNVPSDWRASTSGLPSPVKSPGASSAVNGPQPPPICCADAGGPPAGAVAAVHQQPPVGVAHEQVGLAVTAEVARRQQRA